LNALGGVPGRVALPGRIALRAMRVVARRRPSPRLWRHLLIVAAACVLLSGLYLLWFRNSSFVRVERVSVTGLETKDAERLRAALTLSARSMTTLHVDRARLMRAAAGYPVIRGLRVTPDFPHALRIEVVQHSAAAIAVARGLRIPVAGDGTLLRGVPVAGRLPTIHLSGAPPSGRLRDPFALRQARVLGAAPAALRSRLDKVATRDEGLTVEMRDGPELIFGDATHARAKWAAAARVLADPAARGATYIDLRLPDRPAAGGVAAGTVAPVAPAGGLPESTPETAQTATAPDRAGPASAAPADGPATPAAGPTTPAGAGESAQTPPQQTQQAAPEQQQPAPQAQAPPARAGPGGGATANSQP
jgi:cell division protein FtsQ